ncbi:uncharacterized protein BBA_08655 [Beauveria bassiana ARSEF 2860]|uniref:F-box domain-containing protein n=1 Tax=Beauveria bassiana (strain ARSEF 2860) TaxID=655819 RepID=J4KLL9_BEAB2|nr:uncharacterized protein BBA_08655 [Beauveria bassiana ARSEF 2860]EJP62434.1 hypothetical protein BBA_08655 [Beauveria bassiana ARSEF 2860]
MPNSLWSLARARVKQAYNNTNNKNKNTTTTTTTLGRPTIAAMTTNTATKCKALPLHPGSQPPSYEDSIPDLGELDHLLRRIFENQLYSPLARLPDHILVNIMRSSDLKSLFRLRHTSRIFMILFSVNPTFKSLHLTSDDHQRFYDTARLWEVPRRIIPTHQEAFFLESRRICQVCLNSRRGDRLGRTLLLSMPVLYCSGCRTTHREMHFSARMRNAIDDDRDEMQAFDPNVCDCVDYYLDHPSLQLQRPIRTCPAPAIARWQESAPEGGFISETGRCAYKRHGFTFDGVGIQLRVDFLKCHDATKEMLAMRKTLVCAIDPDAASSAGWGDVVSWMSSDTIADPKQRGLFYCPRGNCDTWRLQTFDVHLRAIEARQMQREKLASTTTKNGKRKARRRGRRGGGGE